MYKKILVPFDNSRQAISAAQHAVKLALVSKSTVTLFHIVQDIANHSEEKIKVLRTNAQLMLEQLREEISGNDVKIDTAVALGNPSKEILKKAKIESYDVIIMGSRGLGKIPGLLMGSVSNKVCSGAVCPVIVIHVTAD
ncbi:universal stress protein [Pelotomaculum terephthalicicum JT]|uniref:universal stress protein n=1 Tax=Pelotomaculum TaxID=191373 RepID=UPI0009C79E18|nr:MULTISPECIES: universal stress protein [Pelotomaculum]MCG9968294.1 universal stress protein [Pelotomaculum terephthalicicum JT]OPX89501.1 MAG: putative universal stress protein [Pelotomaculum sp. PtaB.Bin117]OPY63258.1 MAG: putative universal stress protein [Pelotomaculum sp. PtaU1.Bin065]